MMAFNSLICCCWTVDRFGLGLEKEWKLLHEADQLKGKVDAINLTDAAAGKTSISSFAAAALLVANGHEPILQVTCRDRNRIALCGDLITISDPDHFTKPWTAERLYPWRGDIKVNEYTCEENNRNKSVNGVTVAK